MRSSILKAKMHKLALTHAPDPKWPNRWRPDPE